MTIQTVETVFPSDATAQSAPKIRATFQLDESGTPVRIKQGDLTHYSITLHIEGAPEDTYAVTYTLHDTYYDPVREARNSEDKFSEELTSYGDYTVQANTRTKAGVFTISSKLSRSLAASYEDQITPEIQAALNDIRNN